MEFIKKLSTTFVMTWLSMVLIACGNISERPVISFTDTPFVPATASRTPFPTLPLQPTFTVAPTKTPTLTPTLNPTQQVWSLTTIPLERTQVAFTQQARNDNATKIAQFPNGCENTYYYYLSPDAKWLATNCGNENAKTLYLQDNQEVLWSIEYTDLFGKDAWDGESSSIKPIFWDLQGGYVYITSTFGGSGGGDRCFPGYGTNGLFRVNLKNGTWLTLVNPADFPGNKIRFSQTGRRYAVNTMGILIVDINTGEDIQIKSNEVMGLVWSPDGTNLAYSTARCNEEGNVIDSSLYIWNAITNESRIIITTDKTLLTPLSWDENSQLKIEGKEHLLEDRKTILTLYEYDINQDELVFIGPYSLIYP
jgi:Tol biopolymer transport system component